MAALLALALPGLVAAAGGFLPPRGNVTELASVASGACSAYGCAGGCGRCLNAGGRPGVKCKGAEGATGYLCPPDGSGDVAYACLDWTFGSAAMRAAEAAFAGEAGEAVYFGVGTYGTASDPQKGLGACYRMKVEGVDRDIIAQSINTGFDVAGNQFDMQVGAGGAGAFNTCVGGGGSMFPGAKAAWGCQYGGVDDRAACASLPAHPRMGAAMAAAGDSLVGLCEYSFAKGVRVSGAGKLAGKCKYNPTLLDVGRVRCPDQLVALTQMQRRDDPATFAVTAAMRPEGFPNAGRSCQSQDPDASGYDPAKISAFCLTRMMDCRKPSGGWTSNIKEELMVPGRRVLQTCTDDGYTRYDVQCGCAGCQC